MEAIYKIEESQSQISNLAEEQGSSAKNPFLQKHENVLIAIRQQNSFWQDLILSFFDDKKHDQALQTLISICDEFKANKTGLLAFLQLFSQSYLQTPLGPRIRYINDFFSPLRNLLVFHFTNGELYHIFSSSLPLLKVLLSQKILKLDLNIAEHLKLLKNEEKCYIFHQITEFQDIILKGIQQPEKEFTKINQRFEYWTKQPDLNQILLNDDLESLKQFISISSSWNSIDHLNFEYEYALNNSETQLPSLPLIDYAAYSNAISIFKYLFAAGHISDYMAEYAISGNAHQIIEFLAGLQHHKLKISQFPVHKCYNYQFLDFLRKNDIINCELNFTSFTKWIAANNFYLLTPPFFTTLFETEPQLNKLISNIFSTECIPYIHFLHDNNLLPEKPELPRLVFLLHEVIQAGHIYSFTILIEKYKLLLFPTHLPEFLLQICRFAQTDMLKMLLVYSKNVLDFGFKDNPTIDGTPLHIACSNGFFSILELLLQQPGIPINCVDMQGNTPLHIALIKGAANCVQLLLQQKGIDINHRNNMDYTPFHLALRHMSDPKDSTIAELFLTFPDLDVNAQTQNNDEHPIILAMHHQLISVVKGLLERPDLNLDATGYTNESLVGLAEELEDETVTKLILNRIYLTAENEKEENTPISKDQLFHYCSTPTIRKDRTPREIIIRGSHYLFANYKKSGIRYVCKEGANFHKEKDRRCPAKIVVPYDILFDPDNAEVFSADQYAIEVLEQHTCGTRTQTQAVQSIDQDTLRLQISTLYHSPDIQGKLDIYKQICLDLRNSFPDEAQAPKLPYALFEKVYNSIHAKENPEKKEKPLLTRRNEPFELFNVIFRGPDNSKGRIICYSSDFQLKLISKTRFVGIDGTFKMAPHDFAQLWVIVANTKRLNVPIAYILLPDKKEATYKNALSLFEMNMKAKQFPPGTTFSMDFETAEINAISSVLIKNGHYIQLCYFHFTQAMTRYFEKLPPNDINETLKAIANMLPFISHDTVYKTIATLKEFQQTRDFAEYFDSIYLKKYSINLWNTTGKPEQSKVTNNICESQNSKMNQRLIGGSHPNLATFKEIIADMEDEYALLYHNKEVKEEQTYSHASEENDFVPAFTELLVKLQSNNQTTTEIELPLEASANIPAPKKKITFKHFEPNAKECIRKHRKAFFATQDKRKKKKIVNQASAELLDRFNICFSSDKVRNWFHSQHDKDDDDD